MEQHAWHEYSSSSSSASILENDWCERGCGFRAAKGHRACCRSCELGRSTRDPSSHCPTCSARAPLLTPQKVKRTVDEHVARLARWQGSTPDRVAVATALSAAFERRVSESLARPLTKVISFAAKVSLEEAPFVERLRSGVKGKVRVSQADCARVLCRALFGLGEISFERWFSQGQREKIKCLAVYLSAIKGRWKPKWTGRTLEVVRKIVGQFEPATNTGELSGLKIVPKGSIEGASGLRADFANKELGGGALGRGLAQEEILFVTHFELLAFIPHCDAMGADEAIELRGAERFADHTGYGSDDGERARPFACGGPYRDKRADTARFVALDATDYRASDPLKQHEKHHVDRELRKVVAACQPVGDADAEPFATGQWGCGVFGGDPLLKALIQWLGASICGRAVHYFAFADKRVAARLEAVVADLRGAKIRDLYFVLTTLRTTYNIHDQIRQALLLDGNHQQSRLLAISRLRE
ncbi:hypothetical protein CTAYLR_002548 [Chrysophaeum taylorii]|uniref:PARG catalytic Macro domain-containing protein n=1 Tax=Chrysophaeum taylorii TaxID=2483200 RepID=A0AAD7UH65_9STRA|nr:hypothetical protein CTAYLR_002548 [Chrysophaeum taylorii]